MVRRITLYFFILFDIFLGFLFGPFLLFCMILLHGYEQLGFLAISPLIVLGFYMFMGGLRFFKLIRGGKIVITDYYDPEVLLPRRNCKIVEKKKLRFLGLFNAEGYYLVECNVCGYLLRMAVITSVSVPSYPGSGLLGNVHIIFQGRDIFERLELD